MHIGSAGLHLIKRFEGFSDTPYLCPANIWTIGYGHVILASERESLTQVDEAQAERLLVRDMRNAERAVSNFISCPLRQNQFDALVCFAFNLGSGALQRSTLRRVINRGDEDAVADQWMRFVWAGGKKLPGLVRRREAELALYFSQ
jgi:GH24 family phage-related lysozyme (muramidase)